MGGRRDLGHTWRRMEAVIPLVMPHLRRAGTVAAFLIAACGRDAGSPPTHRGFTPGMPIEEFRQRAARVGPVSCTPFDVEGMAANQLCAASSAASGVRVVGALGGADSIVPYVVVQEPDSAGGYAALTREWGAPDTLVEIARRWRRGRWIADAESAGDQLTIWLTDTATEARIARHTLMTVRALADTMPFRNVLSAVLDTIRRTSPAGAPMPATAEEVDRAPRVITCSRSPVPAALAGLDGTVSLMYVVDTAGRAERASVRVLEASRRGFVDAAVSTIGTCTFRPGMQHGAPVRVLVQQRIAFHPPSASR
jgi:hypothetical protein